MLFRDVQSTYTLKSRQEALLEALKRRQVAPETTGSTARPVSPPGVRNGTPPHSDNRETEAQDQTKHKPSEANPDLGLPPSSAEHCR